MSTAIKIFNPDEKPYGWLSNDYKYFMRINDEDWNSVTGYIFGNILTTPSYRQIIRKTNPRLARDVFNQLYNKEKNDIVKFALDEALKVKFSDEKLALLLVNTGNSPIVYVSNNVFLGVGVDGSGQNIYGKSLEQIRHVLRVAFKEEKKEKDKAQKDQDLYDTYLANKGLINLIREGNDLKQFMGKSAFEIVNMIGRDNLIRISPRRDFILRTIHKGGLPNIVKYTDNIDNMIMEIRKSEMSNLRLRQLKKRKEIVFDMYADYLLKKHFDLGTEDYAKAKAQQFNSLGMQQKSEIENRLFDLYEKGMLSERLSKSIDETLSSLKIPSEDEVKEAQEMVISYSELPKATETPYIPTKGKPVLVYPTRIEGMREELLQYVDFSPISLTGMLNIDGYLYPTVSHYIVARLLASTLRKDGTPFGIKQAYAVVLRDSTKPITGIESFVDPDEAHRRYEKLSSKETFLLMKNNVEIALSKKFENRLLQDILLSTGIAKLIWNDRSDPVLGVGPKGGKGENFVGKYLMQLRSAIALERKDEKIENLTAKDIEKVIKSDMFVKNWIEMRVKDMCKILLLMKKYIETTKNSKVTFNKNFTEKVLDIIYQPCSGLYGMVDMVKVEVPDYFSNIVISYLSDKTDRKKGDETEETMEERKEKRIALYEVSRVFWQRIVVMIYFLMKNMKNTSLSNIRAVIGKIELMVSKETKCVQYVDEQSDNCIISAIMNLISGITEFNRQTGYSDKIEAKEVAVAISIILNTDISVIESKDSDGVPPVSTDITPPKKRVKTALDKEEKLYDQEDDSEEELVFEGDGVGNDADDAGEDDEKEIEGYEEDDFSPRLNVVVSKLVEMETVSDPEELAKYIESAVEVIKTYKMSRQVKQNRINFFATQK